MERFYSGWSSPVHIPRCGSRQLAQVIEDPELYQQCLASKSVKITIIFLLPILQSLTLENSKVNQNPLIVASSKAAYISIPGEFADGLTACLTSKPQNNVSGVQDTEEYSSTE
jgi:hypothetical protein